MRAETPGMGATPSAAPGLDVICEIRSAATANDHQKLPGMPQITSPLLYSLLLFFFL